MKVHWQGAHLACITGKPGMILRPVLSRMPSIHYHCQKKGHLARTCMQERPLRVTNTYVCTGRGWRLQSGGTNWVDVSESEGLPQDEEPLEVFYLSHLQKSSTQSLSNTLLWKRLARVSWWFYLNQVNLLAHSPAYTQ